MLSTSTDSSLILWSPSAVDATNNNSSIWINRQRFGDVGGQRLGGFTGGLWAKSGTQVLAWGWSGGWRRWCCTLADDTLFETWNETGAITGHNGPVKGLDWSPDGNYLISSRYVPFPLLFGASNLNLNVALTRQPGSMGPYSRPMVECHGMKLLDPKFMVMIF